MGILIFGAGKYGKIYKTKFAGEGGVIAFVDNNIDLVGSTIDTTPVIAPEDIQKYEFEKIVVSVFNKYSACEILNQLDSYGIEKEKIELLLDMDFNQYDEATDNRIIWLKDYAHYAYLMDIPGNVAECGVYRGCFSAYINKYFYDRKLYLFDTFCGFNEGDLDVEISLQNEKFLNSSLATYDKIFTNTNVDRVLRQMTYPDNCIIKKGYFPQSAADVRDIFCFVNLDMDLYQPTLAGLKFFWDKMSLGGVLLLHDYFVDICPGIQKAVIDFENELQMNISKLPIGDSASIALIKTIH